MRLAPNGADILSLFDKNQLPDYSLFATRKIGDNGFSLRGRVGFQADSYKSKNGQKYLINEHQNYNYLIMAGVERNFANIQVGNGISLYWATDLGFNQRITRGQETNFVESEYKVFEYSVNKSNNYYLNGSIGIIQSVTNNLSFRLESSISYHYENYIGKGYFLVFEPNQELPPKRELLEDAKKSNGTGGSKHSNNYLSLIPFNQLLITLKF